MPWSPRISVVIPTKNRPALFTEVHRSLVSQRLPDWEAIVVDDGSAPEDLERLQDIARRDERVRLLRRTTEPAGGNRCRNIGLQHAQAALVVFFDDDDLLSELCLEARLHAMTSQPELDFSVFPYRKFHRTPGDLPDQEVVPLEGDDHIARFLAITPPWHTGSVTWRRAFVSRMGGWHEGVSSWQDWEFALRALSLRPTYRCFPTPCFFVRGPSAAHRTISAQGWLAHHVRSWPVAMESAVEHLARGGLMTARRRALLTMLYLFVAERFVEIGDQVSADAMWSRARRLGLVSLPEHLLGGAILRVHGRVAEALRWTLRGAQEVRRIPAALLRERRPAARSLSSS